jgi:hypothetical protein
MDSATPGGIRERLKCGAFAPEKRTGGPSSALRKPAGETYARRSEEKPAIEETLRHSGLDPESRIVFSGATRRKN